MIVASLQAAASDQLRRCYRQRASGAVSEPQTVFDHKQLYRRFVLRSTTQQPNHQSPTELWPTPQNLGVVASKTWSSRDFTTGATHLSCRSSCLLNNNSSWSNSSGSIFYAIAICEEKNIYFLDRNCLHIKTKNTYIFLHTLELKWQRHLEGRN